MNGEDEPWSAARPVRAVIPSSSTPTRLDGRSLQPEQRDAAEGEDVVEREEREPPGARQYVVRREDDGDRARAHDRRPDAQQRPRV